MPDLELQARTGGRAARVARPGPLSEQITRAPPSAAVTESRTDTATAVPGGVLQQDVHHLGELVGITEGALAAGEPPDVTASRVVAGHERLDHLVEIDLAVDRALSTRTPVRRISRSSRSSSAASMDSSRWRRGAGTSMPWRITRDALVIPARVAPTSCSSSRSLPTASRTSASESLEPPDLLLALEDGATQQALAHGADHQRRGHLCRDGGGGDDERRLLEVGRESTRRQQRHGDGQLPAYAQGDGAAVQKDPDQRCRGQDHPGVEEAERHGAGRRGRSQLQDQ